MPSDAELLDALDRKVSQVFAGKVVRKELVRKLKFGSTVPVYVLEYLLGKYCATNDPLAVEAGLKIVNSTLTENFVRPDEANRVQSMVKEKGRYTLIDKVKVRYLSDDDKYWAEIVNFGHKFVHVPPLRERRDDIIPIAEHFLRQHTAHARLREDAVRALLAYAWPGNVRELRNTITHAVLAARDYEIGVDDLPPLSAARRAPANGFTAGGLESVERDTILSVLETTGGHHRKTAELLGISRRTLTRKLKAYRGEKEDSLHVC